MNPVALQPRKVADLSLDRKLRDLQSCIGMEPMLCDRFNLPAYAMLHAAAPKELEQAAADLNLSFPSAQDWQSYLNEAQTHDFSLREHRLKNNRLGLYFESLLEIWLQNNRFFNPIASHISLYDEKSKQTLGEIDWLLENKLTHELEHWECAVKFYIVQPHCANLYGLRGTSLQDNLGTKLNHIIKHQLRQSLSPQFKNSFGNEKIAKHVCLIKGMLFFEWKACKNLGSREPFNLLPESVAQFLNPNARCSYWLQECELEEFLSTLPHGSVDLTHARENLKELNCGDFLQHPGKIICFIALNRLEWLTPLNHNDVLALVQEGKERLLTRSALQDALTKSHSSSEPPVPLLVAAIGCREPPQPNQTLKKIEFVELTRFFLVTQDWRQRLIDASFP